MWFEGWAIVARVLVTGVIAYAALIFFLRVTGKRTLSKLNAFDLVITVAIGSSFATVLLSQETTLVQGLAGLFLLVALQYAITWLSTRHRWWLRIVKSEPSLLLFEGRMIPDTMRRERLSETEVYAAIRQSGHARMEDIYAVVLETDGSMSVISRPEGVPTALTGAGLRPPERPVVDAGPSPPQT